MQVWLSGSARPAGPPALDPQNAGWVGPSHKLRAGSRSLDQPAFNFFIIFKNLMISFYFIFKKKNCHKKQRHKD